MRAAMCGGMVLTAKSAVIFRVPPRPRYRTSTPVVVFLYSTTSAL